MAEEQTKKIAKKVEKPRFGSQEMPRYKDEENIGGTGISITTGKPRPKSQD